MTRRRVAGGGGAAEERNGRSTCLERTRRKDVCIGNRRNRRSVALPLYIPFLDGVCAAERRSA